MERFFSLDDKIDMVVNNGRNMASMDELFNRVYLFSTENIAGYSDSLSFSKKSLLTVGSSGDQVLNAISCGSNRVHVIDKCPFAKEYFYLKLAALLSLTREEFINFFCNQTNGLFQHENYKAFNGKTYEKIRKNILDSGSKQFWDCMFYELGGKRFLTKKLFNPLEKFDANFVIQTNKYLRNDDEYNKLKERVFRAIITFSVEDIFEADFFKFGIVDYINFSNLIDYYSAKEVSEACKRAANILSDNGYLLIAYLYGENDLSGKSEVLKDLCTDIFGKTRSLHFNSTPNSYHGADSVLVYKKVKKRNFDN